MKNNRRWTFPLNTATWMSVSLAGMALLAGCATKQPEVKPTSTGWVKNQVADVELREVLDQRLDVADLFLLFVAAAHGGR